MASDWSPDFLNGSISEQILYCDIECVTRNIQQIRFIFKGHKYNFANTLYLGNKYGECFCDLKYSDGILFLHIIHNSHADGAMYYSINNFEEYKINVSTWKQIH